jgi:membrane associated rhomboid family serine protease
MIPIGDTLPTRTVPVVTMAIIAAGALVSAAFAVLEGGHGAVARSTSLAASLPPFPALLASLLLYRDLLGIARSTAMLALFGPALEDRCGHGRFLALFLLSGLAASVAQALTHPLDVGAESGAAAVSGLVGAYLLLFRQSKVVLLVPMVVTSRLVEVPALAIQALWFGLEATRGLDPFARAAALRGPGPEAYAAAFATGAVAVVFLKRRERMRAEWWSP